MKKIIFLIVLLLSIRFVSSSLICELQPHFFQGGTEVFQTSDIEFSDFSFSVSCENTDSNQRLLSLTISNYSSNFRNSIKKETIPFLRIKEKRVLFNTELIPNNFNSTNETFYLIIVGINEKNWTFLSEELSKTITFNKIEKKDEVIREVGSLIMPSNYKLGFFIGIAIFILVLFLIWYGNYGQKITQWKQNQRRKKILKVQQEEQWRRQRG